MPENPKLEWCFHEGTIHLSIASDRNEWIPSTDCHLDVLHTVERKAEEWNRAEWNKSYFCGKRLKHLDVT